MIDKRTQHNQIGTAYLSVCQISTGFGNDVSSAADAFELVALTLGCSVTTRTSTTDEASVTFDFRLGYGLSAQLASKTDKPPL